MSILRVVEVYVSYQGEGPNTSRPTVFVRFAGCNLKCPGWPCDTQHAIDPKIFSKIQVPWEPKVLAQYIVTQNVDNVCLTGGEVWLQNNEALRMLVEELKVQTKHAINIECFTNGSLAWDDDASYLIDNFILDWKLPGSGEVGIYKDNKDFVENMDQLNQGDAIKFTIKDRDDYVEAKIRYGEMEHTEASPKVYAGVVWDALDTETLCQWMIEDRLPWYLNVQVHKFVWDPNKLGV